MAGPDKKKLYPNEKIKTVCYISNLPKRPNVEIGEYTYYSDNKKSPEQFYDNIEHHYEFLGDKLIIGKFCALAEGVKFIMNGANHRMAGITTYPFNIFGSGWEKVTPTREELPFKGDTVIGNDVWLGQNVTIMSGVKVGDGAIIAADSTVTKNIEPYTIYGGNPAKFIKKRFSEEKVEFLLKLQWWNWEEENSMIVGFGDVNNSNSCIVRLFVHKNCQKQGIAIKIVNELEQYAKDKGCSVMTTEASITAKGFFEKYGYQVIKEQQVGRKSQFLTNFLMRKYLD